MLGRPAQERKADSRMYRRSEHVGKEPKRHRLAGQVFGIKPKNREDRPSTKTRGLGFAEEDKFGPDENWNTKDPLNSTIDPTYYRKY